MSAPLPPILLVGPTSPLGEAVLIRLGVVGIEVTAYLPNGDDGHTGEYACRLVHAPDEVDRAIHDGATVIDCSGEDPLAVVVRRHAETHRVQHAPLMGDVIRQLDRAGWRDLWRDPWGGRALPLVHEVDVAAAVVDHVRLGRRVDVVGGPECLGWPQVVRRVLAARGRTPRWLPGVGRWPAPQYPASMLDALARAPRLGRRTLAEALTRRDSAARRAIARPGASSIGSSHP